MSVKDDEWMGQRDALQFMSGRYYVYDRKGNVCPNPELDLRPWEDPLYSGSEDYRDCAEFEARVAEKLLWRFVGFFFHEERTEESIRFAIGWLCAVRKEVEEEMSA